MRLFKYNVNIKKFYILKETLVVFKATTTYSCKVATIPLVYNSDSICSLFLRCNIFILNSTIISNQGVSCG